MLRNFGMTKFRENALSRKFTLIDSLKNRIDLQFKILYFFQFERYYPTQRSLQLHLASTHPQQIQTQQTQQLQAQQNSTVVSASNVVGASEIITTAMRHAEAETIVPIETIETTQADGQIIQQFQIQLNDQQAQIVEHIPVMATTGPGGHTQQFQIVQTDPSKPSEQPQIITLYTWGGN